MPVSHCGGSFLNKARPMPSDQLQHPFGRCCLLPTYSRKRAILPPPETLVPARLSGSGHCRQGNEVRLTIGGFLGHGHLDSSFGSMQTSILPPSVRYLYHYCPQESSTTYPGVNTWAYARSGWEQPRLASGQVIGITHCKAISRRSTFSRRG